jgi:hypothetical protein
VSYFIYQSLDHYTQPKTVAEQREIDRANGELVAALAQLGHAVSTPWRSLRHALDGGRRRATVFARPRPLPSRASRVVDLVPGGDPTADREQLCSLASSSSNGTLQSSRR